MRQGCRSERFRPCSSARYDGTALDFAGLEPSDRTSMRLVALREWMLTTSSRACPCCLAERPVWPLWWRLGIAAVCPVHRCLLIDLCPTEVPPVCGRR
ncbi:TniQ family protein [Streptomyces capitiformicae]|uniref:TniQ family protein n=1 Tax=Streptomyces capitiformicae TaxID=2014920 RepID=UPI0035711BC1